jgi:hypothetical protein
MGIVVVVVSVCVLALDILFSLLGLLLANYH